MNFLKIRREFPITGVRYPVLTPLGWRLKPIAYLDNAASAPMPKFLQKKFCGIFNAYYSNIHRASHYFSKISTEKFEEARETVFDFISGDKKTHDVVFTFNTTDSVNLAAHIIKDAPGIILASEMEHHSNYLPYLKNNKVRLFKVRNDGAIDYADLEKQLKRNRVKLVAASGASNVTGIVSDLKILSDLSHRYGAKILIDGAQILAHMEINLKKYNIDFFAAAGHKMYAPGAAFFYGPKKLLSQSYPYRPGGGTVNYVTRSGADYAHSPDRHEGGTPNIACVIVLAEAMRWLKSVGMKQIRDHELKLLKYLLDGFKKIPQLEIYGNLNFQNHLGLLSFNIKDVHHSLTSAILNYEAGVATRNGCHCAHIYLAKILRASRKNIKMLKMILKKGKENLTEKEHLIVPGTVRASLGIFNNKKDIEKLIKGAKMIAEKKWIGKYKYEYGRYSITQKSYL